MGTVASLDLFSKVLYWHVIPSISTLILTAGFISLVVRIFNVKSPQWLYWLFFVPLVKGFVVLTNGVKLWPYVPTTKPLVFSIRLWDPLNMISLPSTLEELPRLPTAIDQLTIVLIIFLLLALIWRWVSLFAFYRSLGGEELHADDAPHLFRVLDALVAKMRTPYPKVTISDKPYILPCLFGVFKPTIILSPELAEESSEDILEAVLAHELAHLKRRDNLLHWISVILRDLLVANPFTHLVFSKIMIAKEQDCDRIAANATGKPRAIAEALAHAAATAREKGIKPLPGNLSNVSESISTGGLVNRRIDMLLVNTTGREQEISWVKGSIIIVLMLFSFFVHLSVTGPHHLLSPVFQF